MKKLGRSISENIVESKGEQRNLLPSSKDTGRCSSLGFITNQGSDSVEADIDYLASILAEIFLAMPNEQYNSKSGGD